MVSMIGKIMSLSEQPVLTFTSAPGMPLGLLQRKVRLTVISAREYGIGVSMLLCPGVNLFSFRNKVLFRLLGHSERELAL
jgi:hypothetical protein